jgi:hypothetical protein
MKYLSLHNLKLLPLFLNPLIDLFLPLPLSLQLLQTLLLPLIQLPNLRLINLFVESYCAFVEILVPDYETLRTRFRETAGMRLVLRVRLGERFLGL